MWFERRGVKGKQPPSYPDVDEVNRDRRGFLARLGSTALGAAVLGLGAVGLVKCSGDMAPPADGAKNPQPAEGVSPVGVEPPPAMPRSAGSPIQPAEPFAAKRGGDVAPPAELKPLPEAKPAEPIPSGQVPVPELRTPGEMPPVPVVEMRKPGEMPAPSLPKGSENEKDVVEQKDVVPEKDTRPEPKLGGIIAPPKEPPQPPRTGGVAPPPPQEPRRKLGGVPMPPQEPEPPKPQPQPQ